MKSIIKILAIFIPLVLASPLIQSSENYPQIEVTTTSGVFVIELDRNIAPKTVENFLNYLNNGFYKNTVFHRVIPGLLFKLVVSLLILRKKKLYLRLLMNLEMG